MATYKVAISSYRFIERYAKTNQGTSNTSHHMQHHHQVLHVSSILPELAIPKYKKRVMKHRHKRSIPQYRIYRLKGRINFFPYFSAGKNDFARHEYQKNDLWLDHTINETGEEFGFVLGGIRVEYAYIRHIGHTDEKVPCEKARPSRRMGNRTSHEPTMFCILKSVNFALKPNFCIIRAYFLEASLLSSSDFAPVTTILPDAKISAVVLGSRMRIMTAAKR